MKLLTLFISLIHTALTVERDFYGPTVIPSSSELSIGGSAYIKLKTVVDSQTACAYKAPGRKEINSAIASVKFSAEDKCGITIESVQKIHAGAWQLISTFKNSTYEMSIKGLSTIVVKESESIETPGKQFFSSDENFAPLGVDLSYCFVSKSLGRSKLSDIDNAKCVIPKDLSSDFRDGEWNVKLGVLGEPREVSYAVQIQSSDETIETEVKRNDNESIQLLCRVRNFVNALKFCRFERIDGFGINLEDGTVLENYRSYGQGLDFGECGLEITKMTASDKTQWKCFVGLMASAPIAYKTLTAVIDASDFWNKLKILNDDTELFVVDNKSAIIQCNVNNPFDYCWFLHPIHKMLSVSDRKELSDQDDFQYFGEGFHLGHCGIKIRSFHFSDGGVWKCGVGRGSMREAVKTMKIEVKASSMMAITKQIEDFERNSAVIQCRAIPFGSLASCHFLTPAGEGFSIDEQVTASDAIDSLYYFDPNRKLADGYCTVVIKSLNKEKHAGKWTCSGRMLGTYDESYDTVYLTIDGVRGASISLLSIVITTPILLVLVLSAMGVKIWKRRRQARNEILDDISMHTMGSNSTEGTTSSDESRVASSYSA